MKQNEVLRLRIDDSARDAFKKACEKVGTRPSAAMRQLCEASVEYVGKFNRWPKHAVIKDLGDKADIPMPWLSAALSKVKNLEEMKDIVLTVMIALPLDWDSDFSPHADHTKELNKAIDDRLKEIRSRKDGR